MVCPTSKQIYKRETRELMTAEQAGRCVYCGRPMVTDPSQNQSPAYATFEHITARSRDPRPGWMKAQVMACMACNKAKADKPLLPFLLQLSQMKSTPI